MPLINAREQDLATTLSGQFSGMEIANGKFGNDNKMSVIDFMNTHSVNPTEMRSLYQAGEQLVDPQEGFLSKFMKWSAPVFETMAWLPNTINHLLTNSDIRKAVPNWIAPDKWEEEGIHNEIYTVNDVLNIWSDGRLDEWYQKEGMGHMIGEAVFKTGTFLLDVFTDPLTYVPMGNVVNIARKALPMSAQAHFAGKVATKTMKPTHAKRAQKLAAKYYDEVTERFKVTGSEADKARQGAAHSHLLAMETNLRKVEKMHAARQKGIATNIDRGGAPGGFKLDKAPIKLATARGEVDALQASFEKNIDIMRNHIGEVSSEEIHNIVMFGADDGMMHADAFGVLTMGGDAGSVTIRWPKFRGHYLSTTITPPEVVKGPGGKMISRLRAQDIKDAKTVVQKHIKEAEAELADLNVRKAAGENVEEEIIRVRKRLDAKGGLQDKLDKIKEGKIPDSVDYDSSYLPASARRSPTNSDFLEQQFGKVAKIAGVALYPNSYMPMPAAWFNHLLREPARVFESVNPEMRMRMMNGMTMYQTYSNAVREDIRGILTRGDVLEGGLKKKARQAIHSDANMTVNKERSEKLWELLDAQARDDGEALFQKLWDEADDGLRTAHDELRVVLDDMAEKLYLDMENYVTGYAPRVPIRDYSERFLDDNWFKNAELGPDWEGLPTKKEVFLGHLMERKGKDVDYIKDIAQVMDIYTRGAARKMYLEPMMQDLSIMSRETAKQLDIPWLNGYTEMVIKNIKGSPSSVKKISEFVLGDRGTAVARGVAGKVATLGYSAALSMNMRYPIMSILQSLNTTAAQYGPLRTLKGMAAFMTPKGQKIAKMAGLDGQINQIYAGLSDWAGKLRLPGIPSISQTEFTIRGMTFHAALGDILTEYGVKNLDEITDMATRDAIIGAAARSTEEINHIFGVIGKPAVMGRVSTTGSMVATQFMSFPFKQTETLMNIAMDNPGHFMQYLHLSGKIAYAAAHDQNISVSEYVGGGYIEDLADIFRNQKRTIPMQTIDNMLKVVDGLWRASTGEGLSALYDAQNAFFKSVEMMVPAKVGLEQTGRRIEGLATITQGDGRVDVARNRRTNFETVVGVLTGKGSYNELRQGEKLHTKGQEDFVSVLTGMQSIKDKVSRDILEGKYKMQQMKRSKQAELTQALWDEVRTGEQNPAKIQTLVAALRQLGVQYKDLSEIDDRRTKYMYAANMAMNYRNHLLPDGEARVERHLRRQATERHER